MRSEAARNFQPEEEALLRLAVPRLSVDDAEECRDLLTRHRLTLDWGRLVDLAGRHRVLPLISANLVHHGLFHSADGEPFLPYHYLFTSVYAANTARNQAVVAECEAVTRAMATAGIPFAVRKGLSLVERVYQDVGKRRMHDLDLLIRRADAAEARAALAEFGYAEGKVSVDGSTIEPYSRRTQRHWSMHISNALPQIRFSGRPDITVFTVDLCFGIAQKSWTATMDTQEILDRSVAADGPFRWLHEDDQFIDLCAHMFKEATTLYYIRNGADIQLQKYVDLAGSCPAHDDETRWAALIAAIRRVGMADIVYYALHQLDSLHENVVPDAVLDDLRPDDTSYLEEYGGTDGQLARWSTEFHRRVFADRRTERATVVSALPQN